MISFVDFPMDKSVVAPVIYGASPHYSTNKGVVISQEVTQELRRFLSCFNASVGVDTTPYYRIDAYFDEKSLWILEVNAAFVDGWGTALNLCRACGISLDSTPYVFPKWFACEEDIYLPELELFVSELNYLGMHDHEIRRWDGNGVDPIYVYGRAGSCDKPNLRPFDGVRLDNKLHLGNLSLDWRSDIVRIPCHHFHRLHPWEDVPIDVVLKFCEKGGEESLASRQSVIFQKPGGKAPFLKRCYKAETLLAQETIQPARQRGNNCQIVLLSIGNQPLTGYVQYSQKNVINDNSIHGPLKMN
jgi:hypothetical protein